MGQKSNRSRAGLSDLPHGIDADAEGRDADYSYLGTGLHETELGDD
ncbi:MAG: hypothetical protein JSS51_10100, partial [Planctomycetes bacterium]|nr:hypothetical protein [Planctomycetota bacterium]